MLQFKTETNLRIYCKFNPSLRISFAFSCAFSVHLSYHPFSLVLFLPCSYPVVYSEFPMQIKISFRMKKLHLFSPFGSPSLLKVHKPVSLSQLLLYTIGSFYNE